MNNISLRLLKVVTWLLVVVAIEGVHCDDRVTPEQAEQVAQFRPLIQDLIYKDWMNTDEYLIRWLRARKGNQQSARTMLKTAMEWRKSNKIDEILAEDFADIEKDFSVILEGEDQQGHPLTFFNIGALDFRKFAIGGKLQKATRYFYQCLELVEHVLRHMSNENRTLTRTYIVADLHGFNFRQHVCVQCFPFGVTVVGGYELYYPDRTHRFIGVNAPRAVIPVIDIARGLASESTIGIIQLFDNDRGKWQQVLLSEIDADQLPKQFGGTRQVVSKTIADLKKSNPVIKAIFDEAVAEAKKVGKKG